MTQPMLNIAPTRTTPGVDFDLSKANLALYGCSTPENAGAFYGPMLQWLEDHLPAASGPLTFDVRLTFFNSSSLKGLFKVMEQVQVARTAGTAIDVRWYAEADDDVVVDTVAMLRDVLGLPIELLPMDDGQVQPVN